MVPARIVLFIAQILAHLGFQRPLQHRLGQLFEQPVFSDDLLGALIVLQQLIDQRLVDSHESFSFSHGRLHSYFYSSSPHSLCHSRGRALTRSESMGSSALSFLLTRQSPESCLSRQVSRWPQAPPPQQEATGCGSGCA